MLREFINKKVDNGPKGLTLLVGDLNVNSCSPSTPLRSFREEMKGKKIALTQKDNESLGRLENEYHTVMDILSNFGQEIITDCL
jgi:hypothetical protein